MNTQADESSAGDGTCSLREAVAAANSPGTSPMDCPAAVTSGTTTIALPAGRYHLTPGSGLSFADGANVSLQGASSNPSQTVIDGGDDPAHRGNVLQVANGASVTLTGLTVRGGYTVDGAAGADNSMGPGEAGNPAQSGGGIENWGTVTLIHVAITANTTGAGGHGGNSSSASGGNGGNGGNGGGIYNAGTLTAADSTIIANAAGAGGAGGSGTPGGNGGHGGAGGGIESDGLARLFRTTVSGNGAGAGGGADFSGGVPGPGGAGGGIDTSGYFNAYSATVAQNTAGAGVDGGNGGGIATTGGGTLTVAQTTINGNAGGRGSDGTYPGYVVGGNGGAGGGIFASGGTATLTNDTIAGNAAGAGGSSPGGSPGGGGGGGGIEYANPGSMTLLAVTITQNAVGRPGFNGASGVGGGIEDAGTSLSETSTLVASNSRPNCAGKPGDGGYNLHFPAFDPSCPGGTGNPKLGTLAGNGGLTETVALQAGSAAIDQVPAGSACPPTDGRVLARPQPAGGMCDIGAYEYAPLTCVGENVTAGHATPITIQLSCTDPAEAPLGYALDAEPAHGTLSGLNAAAGTVIYTPAATYSGPDSFAFHAANGNGTAASQTVTISVSKPSQPARAPALSRFQISPPKFFDTAKRKGSQHKRKTGATISYNDTGAATTTLTVFAARAGTATKGGCVEPLRHKPKRAKRCTRYVAIGGFTHKDRAGSDRLPFSGRLGHHLLAAGSYRLQAQPALGRLRGRLTTVSFQILG